MKKFLTATAIGAMLTAGVAMAMQTQTPAAPTAKPVTKAEMIARADAQFDRLDTNRDGQLSAEERKAGMEAARKAMAARKGGEMSDFMPRRGGGGGMGERMLSRIDTNGDGMISKAENRAMVEARFARMDTNKNGTIDADERGKRGGKWKRDGKRGAGKAGGPGMGGMMMADANKDGVITRAEYDAMSAQRFTSLDTNKDGRIDATEMKAQRDKMRTGMKQMRERRGDMPLPPAPQGE